MNNGAFEAGAPLAYVTAQQMKRLFISEAEQQPLVNTVMFIMEFGLAMLLVTLAMVMIWRLLDISKKKGRWTEEIEHELSAEVR